jgi:DNA gyrase/topoisomerase IV subunit A
MDSAEQLRHLDARMAVVEVLVLLGEPGNAARLVEIIQASADEAELCRMVADEWGLTQIQARALADVQFRRLTKESRQEFLEELEAGKAMRAELCADPGQ